MLLNRGRREEGEREREREDGAACQVIPIYKMTLGLIIL